MTLTVALAMLLARERAVGFPLAIAEEVQRPAGAGHVTVGNQRGRDLVQVARPHEVVRTRRRSPHAPRPCIDGDATWR